VGRGDLKVPLASEALCRGEEKEILLTLKEKGTLSASVVFKLPKDLKSLGTGGHLFTEKVPHAGRERGGNLETKKICTG